MSLVPTESEVLALSEALTARFPAMADEAVAGLVVDVARTLAEIEWPGDPNWHALSPLLWLRAYEMLRDEGRIPET